MTSQPCVVGLDYGTESARGVLIGAADGEILAVHRVVYRHGVMSESLPDGTSLPPDWALQDADDYLHAAEEILRRLSEAAVAAGGHIAGIGIDFTASTVLPVTAQGAPLSRHYPQHPHAYVKLWKHHAAQPWVAEINDTGGEFLAYTGGETSCEWMFAKAAQLRSEAPGLWAESARFMEAGDWLVSELVGAEVRSTCQAGYKAHYLDGAGYPSEVDTLIPGLRERLREPTPIGEPAGELAPAWMDRIGLTRPPVVAVATIDAHAVMPGVGVSTPGTLVATLGTSAGYMLVSPDCRRIPGIGGVVRDGILPGYWGYEAGQAGFGDLLAWFVRTFPSGEDADASFAHYNRAAAALPPGASGVMALDWWNGCRTPLIDPELSGVFVGMTLQTTREELYRALLESLGFGMRRVVDTLTEGGLDVDELVVTSGLAEKNPFIVQLVADVTGRDVRVPDVQEATARGAAIHGAVAAGLVDDFQAGAAALGAQRTRRVLPVDSATVRYTELYGLYRTLSRALVDSDVMPALRRLRGATGRP